MLIQHLPTERIFRKVFDNPEFTRRNIIAAEIEKVIDSLTSKHFSRDAFLKDLDYFYRAIEDNAKNAQDYSEKQTFLNTVYERFFQGFSKKEADTHGIVYTPQPIVNFMVRSVEEILKKEFAKSLSDKDVHILDPFVGTGNFIVRVMQEIKRTALPYRASQTLASRKFNVFIDLFVGQVYLGTFRDDQRETHTSGAWTLPLDQDVLYTGKNEFADRMAPGGSLLFQLPIQRRWNVNCGTDRLRFHPWDYFMSAINMERRLWLLLYTAKSKPCH